MYYITHTKMKMTHAPIARSFFGSHGGGGDQKAVHAEQDVGGVPPVVVGVVAVSHFAVADEGAEL